MLRGAEATGKDTRGIFRFNPGIERKTFPDYNPYTISRCRDCDIAKGNLKLARYVPEGDLCANCVLLRDRKNLEKKKKRKVVGYNRYKFSYKGKEWNVKVEIHAKGFEQFYAIVK